MQLYAILPFNKMYRFKSGFLRKLDSVRISWAVVLSVLNTYSTMGYEREIGLLVNIVLKLREPREDIWCIWGGRG